MNEPVNKDWHIIVHLKALIEDAATTLMHFADTHDRPDRDLYRITFLDKIEYDMKCVRQSRRGTRYFFGRRP